MYIGTKVQQGKIEVEVVIDGKPQPLYRTRGDDRVYVAGEPGQSYRLRVRNLHTGRVEVINSVDGRHSLRDEPADAYDCRGLIFAANKTGEFSGWRIDDSTTREFVFGDPSASIAAQAGAPDNIGVIGFAVHGEKYSYILPKIPYEPPVSYGPAVLRGGESKSAGSPGLGTGMGAEQSDSVGRTSFTRDGSPPTILEISYDTEESLREQGIIAPARPQAFPSAQTGYQQYQTTR